jgi:hypothetical protein
LGKTLLIIFFLISLMVSVYVFLTAEDESPREQLLNVGETEPRIVVDDIFVYQYRDHTIEANFSAKLGHFLEPNLVEVYASVRGTRYRPKGRIESLKCEAASVTVAADTMADLFSQKDVSLLKGEVEDQVQIGLDDNYLFTEYAEYLAVSETIQSKEPVQGEGPNRKFRGEEGFTYDLKSEVLLMSGLVGGEVIPEQTKSKTK